MEFSWFTNWGKEREEKKGRKIRNVVMDRFEARPIMVMAEGRSKRKREIEERERKRKKRKERKKGEVRSVDLLLAVVALSSWVSGAVIS